MVTFISQGRLIIIVHVYITSVKSRIFFFLSLAYTDKSNILMLARINVAICSIFWSARTKC